MATHSSVLAWRIPWTEEPGGLQSMGSLRVRHDWATLLSLFTFMHWRRNWQPTPVFLLGESQGWGSLVGCHLWGQTRLKRLSNSRSLNNGLGSWERVEGWHSMSGETEKLETQRSHKNDKLDVVIFNCLVRNYVHQVLSQTKTNRSILIKI